MSAEPIGKLVGGVVNKLAADTGRVKQFPGSEKMNQNAVAEHNVSALVEQVMVKGDLSSLSAADRVAYYDQVCRSIGLNPLTKPFEYLTLNNKLVLYARRDATDQLRNIHHVSVTDMEHVTRGDIYIVTVKVENKSGRTDMATGAVNIANLKGDFLANAILKTETKAKRRATLSICGLGMLDETEIETIPNAQPAKRTMAEISANKKRREDECAAVQKDLSQIETLSALQRYEAEHLTPQFMGSLGNAQFAVEEWLEQRRNELSEPSALILEEDEPPPETTEERLEDKAEYTRRCHSTIEETKDETSLLNWWNSREEKNKRREHLLTKEEVQDLMVRVFERRASLSGQGASLEHLTGDPTSTTAEPEDRAGDAPRAAESDIDASEAWRAELLELLANAKTARAIDTIVATRVEPEMEDKFPGDAGDIARAIERARKRVSKA